MKASPAKGWARSRAQRRLGVELTLRVPQPWRAPRSATPARCDRPASRRRRARARGSGPGRAPRHLRVGAWQPLIGRRMRPSYAATVHVGRPRDLLELLSRVKHDRRRLRGSAPRTPRDPRGAASRRARARAGQRFVARLLEADGHDRSPRISVKSVWIAASRVATCRAVEPERPLAGRYRRRSMAVSYTAMAVSTRSAR